MAAETTKKPWYKKIWIWAIVAGVIVVSGIGNALSGGDEPEPSAEPTQATVEDTPEAESTEEPAEADDAERSEQLEADIKAALGTEEFSDLYAQDPTLWGGYISAVTVDGSNAYITLQVGHEDDNRDDLGARAAQALSTLLAADTVEDINWIIVQDASEAVIAQEQPNPTI